MACLTEMKIQMNRGDSCYVIGQTKVIDCLASL